jgi:hypothetical protein
LARMDSADGDTEVSLAWSNESAERARCIHVSFGIFDNESTNPTNENERSV